MLFLPLHRSISGEIQEKSGHIAMADKIQAHRRADGWLGAGFENPALVLGWTFGYFAWAEGGHDEGSCLPVR